MKNKGKLAAGIILAAGVLTGKYIHDQCFKAAIKNKVFYSDKIKNDLKITHISDLHSNAIKNMDELIKNIKKFNPDLIFFTGDMIDYPTENKIKRTMYFFNRISQLGIKTYYVSGNHEEASENSEVFYGMIKKLGVKFLKNEGDFIKIGEDRIYIYGTT